MTISLFNRHRRQTIIQNQGPTVGTSTNAVRGEEPPAPGPHQSCPEGRDDASGSATRKPAFDARLAGAFGVELDVEAKASLKRLEVVTTEKGVTLGDVQIGALTNGQPGCETSITETIQAKIPFDARVRGNLEIDFDAFASVIARAKDMQIDSREVSLNPEQAASASTPHL